MSEQQNSSRKKPDHLTYFIRNNGPFHVINEEYSSPYEGLGEIMTNKEEAAASTRAEAMKREKSRCSRNQEKKNGISAEEIHRIKQREQYKRMLNNMEQLIQVLPSVTEYKKQKTKQFTLSEAYQYIHYLQLCIYHLAKENGESDEAILQKLHWEQECTNVSRCMSRIIANLAEHPYCKREKVHNEKKTKSQNEQEHLRQEKPKKMKRKPSVRKDSIAKASSRKSDLIYTNNLHSNSGGCVSSTSQFASPQSQVRKRQTYESAKEKNGDGRTQTIKSPTVIPFHVISPPSSYRRTIIQDSPQESSVSKNWKEVSVRSCSPWMPKPDCVYETIEDLAEDIVENYCEQSSGNGDDDTEDNLMMSSFSTVSFLDSSFSDEEEIHHQQHQPIRLKTKDLNKEELAQIQVDVHCPKNQPDSGSLLSVSPSQRTFTSPQYYSNALNDGLSSPEHLLGFSPRLFLTSRRLTEAK